MAVAYLNPDSNVTAVGWDSSFSQTPSHLSQGDTSNEWRTVMNNTGKAIWTLGNFDFGGLNVGSITNIKHQLIIGLDARGGSSNAIATIRNASNQTLYSETHANTAGAGFQTFTGTARTTSDGSSAWTDSDLDGLGMFLTCAGAALNVHIVQQLYIEVTYVEAGYGHDVIGVASADIGEVNGVATANIDEINGL